MSLKARTSLSSYTTWLGISFLAILQKRQSDIENSCRGVLQYAPTLFFINLLFLKNLITHGNHFALFNPTKKTGAVTHMAGRHFLNDFDQQAIGITVKINFFHFLCVP